MKDILRRLKTVPKEDITAFSLIGTAFLFIFIMAFSDGTISDESFYLSIPYRLMNGDGLLTDEWHLSQLSSVLLYIPVFLFRTCTGSFQGIILFMRCLFCFLQLFTGIVFYRTFREYKYVSALFSAVFILFSVIGMRTLSYNTLGAALLVLLICTLYSADRGHTDLKMLLSGTLIAMFILCQPVGIVFYIIYFAVFIALSLKAKKDGSTVPCIFRTRAFILTAAGILPVLLFFLFILFKNSDIETIIKCIHGIFTDVEHMTVSQELGIETFSLLQFFSDMTMAAGAVPLIIAAVFSAAAVIIKKKNRALAVIITAAVHTAFTLAFWFCLIFSKGETDDINFFFFPLAFSGLPLFILTKKKNYKVFLSLWCTGIMYALFMTVSSNLGLHASVNGYIISSAGSLLITKELTDELKKEEKTGLIKTASALLTAVFAFTAIYITTDIISTAASRATYNSARVENGIYKNISLPSDQALLFTNIYNDAQRIKEETPEDARLFVIENVSAMYLECERDLGAFSGWFICEQLGFPEIRSRFREYYEIFPENIPSYVYIPAYMYTENGLKPVTPRIRTDYAFGLFEGKEKDIGSGLLIEVTGLKDEQN